MGSEISSLEMARKTLGDKIQKDLKDAREVVQKLYIIGFENVMIDLHGGYNKEDAFDKFYNEFQRIAEGLKDKTILPNHIHADGHRTHILKVVCGLGKHSTNP